MPPALESRPKVKNYLLHSFEAFRALHRRRQYGMHGPLPLSFSDIKGFGELIGLRKARQLMTFCKRVAICDDAYLEFKGN